MVTITVIFWGQWDCWILPLFSYKGNGRHWKLQMMFARLKNVLSSHTVLGACLKLNVAIEEQWQPSKISKSPLMLLLRHLLPILICCPLLTNAWRKSVIWSHLVPGISRYHICRVCSLEVNVPLQKGGLGILEESRCT